MDGSVWYRWKARRRRNVRHPSLAGHLAPPGEVSCGDGLLPRYPKWWAVPGGADFITMIRDYIVSHHGSVYTQMLRPLQSALHDAPALR
ncbi:hypothetical protein V8E54_006823 [Elaphomyces granulatus]